MEPLVIEPNPPAAAAPAFATIGIVGLGLIGGSIALAVRERWPSSRLIGIDNPAVLESARTLRAIDAGSEDLSALAEADLVILATPVRQSLALLPKLASHVASSAIVTDTGSTKRAIVDAAAPLASSLSFVGSHPLGGAAVGGLQHAKADLFLRRPWLLTPTPSAPPDAVRKLAAFAVALGSTTHVMSAEEHDRLLAFLSHLPQIAASALMGVVGGSVGGDGLALAGRGLVDTTRLASSPSDIWRDIAATNADQIGPALDALIERLQALRADLAGGSQLSDIFADAARWREQLILRSTL